MTLNTAFTDEDLKRLKDSEAQHGPHSQYPKGFIEALLARLEAAEVILSKANRLTYEDGLIMYELNFSSNEIAALMEAWRKAAGKE